MAKPPSVVAERAKSSLDAVFALAAKQKPDDEMLSHLARYLCILASGYVEVSIQAILLEYIKKRSCPQVMNFAESRLEGITNLNEERVYQLLNSFDPSLADAFRRKRSDAQKDALDSVLANRNLIAHGKSVGITLHRMKEYYKELTRSMDLIERECVKL